MANFISQRQLSRRFVGFDQIVNDEKTHQSRVFTLISSVQNSSQLNLVGDQIYYFHNGFDWTGPFLEVLGPCGINSGFNVLNFCQFTDMYLPICTSQVIDFRFSDGSKSLHSLRMSLPEGSQVVASLLSCDIDKIELHFFVQ